MEMELYKNRHDDTGTKMQERMHRAEIHDADEDFRTESFSYFQLFSKKRNQL